MRRSAPPKPEPRLSQDVIAPMLASASSTTTGGTVSPQGCTTAPRAVPRFSSRTRALGSRARLEVRSLEARARGHTRLGGRLWPTPDLTSRCPSADQFVQSLLTASNSLASTTTRSASRGQRVEHLAEP